MNDPYRNLLEDKILPQFYKDLNSLKTRSQIKDFLILFLTWEGYIKTDSLKQFIDYYHKEHPDDHLIKYFDDQTISNIEKYFKDKNLNQKNDFRYPCTGELLNHIKKTGSNWNNNKLLKKLENLEKEKMLLKSQLEKSNFDTVSN